MSMLKAAETGKRAIHFLEIIGLFIIAVATVYAAGSDILHMIEKHKVELGDLLMLFLYLEVLAMTAIYLDSGKLPIRLPIYIAIVALARFLILDMKELDATSILLISITILVLAIAVLALRFGSLRFPYREHQDPWGKKASSGRQAHDRHHPMAFTRAKGRYTDKEL